MEYPRRVYVSDRVSTAVYCCTGATGIAGNVRRITQQSDQNPPTIPTLAIVWIVSRLRGSKVIIDWHNLGYTLLAMRLGERSRFVALARK